MKKFLRALFAVIILGTSLSCDDSEDVNMPENTIQGPDLVVYGVTPANELVSFNAKKPGMFLSKSAITGVASGEQILSIDFRPSTGELYALSSASKLYVINTSSFSARAIGTTAFTPALSGAIASIDFNPTVDRIRLVSNTGQNLRLHPETGATAATDMAINGPGTPSITGIAYTNSKAGVSSTILYDIDIASGKLFKQDPPNNGTLVEVGSLGITLSGQAAFDINPNNSIALLGTGNNLYLVDINNGKAGLIGSLQEPIRDLAIPTEPVAYAVDSSNNLQIFNPENPSPISKAIAGLQSGENILGIDFRPLNGQLYALGSSSRLYTINLATGAATAVNTTPFSTMLQGTDFAFDFNPTVDRIRVVSNTGQNLRINPNDATIAAVDGNINPGTPAVSAAAYTNNFAGATATVLFVIDHNSDKLYQQNPPNNGTLTETGSLGIDISSANGFDIGSKSQKAYLMATVNGTTKIYTVNTSTGAVTSLSNFPNAVKAFSIGLGF